MSTASPDALWQAVQQLQQEMRQKDARIAELESLLTLREPRALSDPNAASLIPAPSTASSFSTRLRPVPESKSSERSSTPRLGNQNRRPSSPSLIVAAADTPNGRVSPVRAARLVNAPPSPPSRFRSRPASPTVGTASTSIVPPFIAASPAASRSSTVAPTSPLLIRSSHSSIASPARFRLDLPEHSQPPRGTLVPVREDPDPYANMNLNGVGVLPSAAAIEEHFVPPPPSAFGTETPNPPLSPSAMQRAARPGPPSYAWHVYEKLPRAEQLNDSSVEMRTRWLESMWSSIMGTVPPALPPSGPKGRTTPEPNVNFRNRTATPVLEIDYTPRPVRDTLVNHFDDTAPRSSSPVRHSSRANSGGPIQSHESIKPNQMAIKETRELYTPRNVGIAQPPPQLPAPTATPFQQVLKPTAVLPENNSTLASVRVTPLVPVREDGQPIFASRPEPTPKQRPPSDSQAQLRFFEKLNHYYTSKMNVIDEKGNPLRIFANPLLEQTSLDRLEALANRLVPTKPVGALPEREIVLDCFTCSIREPSPQHGMLFITLNFLVFETTYDAPQKGIVLRLHEICSVQKDELAHFGTSLEFLCMNGAVVTFTGFLGRMDMF
eukprot:TRINITY_DN83269_c0_g1_i1.p1 TRINITY_DN83269_c0_g1~~TRINITY_DN83269_c0_g1_i1.p1  ORF type:complete len:619 (-),score=61.15 TRINITY_DN83269_c0_g1_i1:134-1954(-)